MAGRTDVFTGDAWQLGCAIGCGSVGLGVALLVWPNKSVAVTELLLGLTLLLTAAWQLAVAFRGRMSGWLKGMELVSALLSVLLALWCMRSGDWQSLLAVWVGIGWMIRGIVAAMTAVWSPRTPGSTRYEIYGLLTLLAGLMVMVWPIDGLAGLGALVGVCLIMMGGMEIRLTARVRPPHRTESRVGVRGLLGPRARPAAQGVD